MKHPFKTISILSLYICCSFAGFAQHHDFDSLLQNDESFRMLVESEYESMDIFEAEKPFKMTIVSDFKNLVKQKGEPEYQPAVLLVTLNDTVAVRREIKIKARGNMRREACYFPPLKLNFPKKEATLKLINEFDKIKMVVKCKKAASYEQYLFSEYYAYKLLNLISDYSFRVRLLEVTYQDTSEKYKSGTSHAYLIESVDQLADRLNAVPSDLKNIRDQYTDKDNLGRIYLFQYLIGNTDWSIPGRHNIDMIKPEDLTNNALIAIPYDFDGSGIVNTIYAVPNAAIGTETVRERVYRGVCIEETHIRQAVERFIQRKNDVYALYNDSPYLDKNNLKETIRYIDEFYEVIENEDDLKRDILESCRQ